MACKIYIYSISTTYDDIEHASLATDDYMVYGAAVFWVLSACCIILRICKQCNNKNSYVVPDTAVNS